MWYVAKHDNVSRLMERIDDSKSRSQRQLISAADLIESGNGTCTEEGDRRIMLDPMGNIPLKVYEVCTAELDNVANESWVPRLVLSDEEKDVVESDGSVMLLGRSGTGKTICIVNRMDFDRQRLTNNPLFSQLFVARSHRLCRYVSEAVGTKAQVTFTTFDDLLSDTENRLPKVANIRDEFSRSNHMTFGRFKKEIYSGRDGKLDPLLVWTSIRSFIKGSIEAALKISNVVDKEDFLSFEMFGSNRCRLSLEQRGEVYTIFKRYEQTMIDFDLWDNCDRIMSLLRKMEGIKSSNPNLFQQLTKSKTYIDECQDYTQAECLLFFYLSGPGNLFFAGDPAQSVVEGVEFRFKDIKSVEHFIGKKQNKRLLEDPKTVNVNFRSHSGVLNIAAAILSCLFDNFPKSAEHLKTDRGIFQGPRPGVFYTVESGLLGSLLKGKLNGTVVLVHDSSVSRIRRMLTGYPLVYGIRAAKGLEFKSIIILDFFRDLPDNVQKPWRELLLGRADDDFKRKYPEIEGQLKLLYTGVTRCIEQLFFAETAASIGGNTFHLRYLTKTSTIKSNRLGKETENRANLATLNKVGDVQTMTLTSDEWLSSGIESAEAAEVADDPEVAESLLEKAIYCFQQANDHELARMARAHRASIRFKLALPPMSTQKVVEAGNRDFREFEVTAAKLVENLLTESLLTEAKDLCSSVLPYLPVQSQERLSKDLISKM